MTNNCEKILTYRNEVERTPNDSITLFKASLKRIQQTNWKFSLTQSVKKFSLESYKLTQLTPKNVEKLYQKVSSKYTINLSERMTWFQNELRLYIWLLATFTGVFKISPLNYTSQQLKQISEPFFGISKNLCEYQFRAIVCPELFRAWEPNQNLLLSEIILKHSQEGSWSSIAKQLFLKSDKKYFRTPQTCRQRWQNHLDYRKVRGQWSIEEDYLLIKYIISEGKRWSTIAKKIGDTRTQHMVKNRFQTILRRQFKLKKKPSNIFQQFQFCKQHLKNLFDKISSQRETQQNTQSIDLLQQKNNLWQSQLVQNYECKQVIKDTKDGSKILGEVAFETNKQEILRRKQQINSHLLTKSDENNGLISSSSNEVSFQCLEWPQNIGAGNMRIKMGFNIPCLFQEDVFSFRNQYDLMADYLLEQRELR